MNEHYYLIIQEFKIPKTEANRKLRYELEKRGLKNLKFNTIITLTSNKKTRKASYATLLNEMQRKGYIEEFQNDINRNDPIWGGIFGVSSNMKASIKMQYAGEEAEVNFPGRANPVEEDITEDILFYRKASCENSNNYNFNETCRYYRAYLFSCISIVDAFINRHILIHNFKGDTSQDFINLRDAKFNIEKRLELLFKFVTSSDVGVLRGSEEWCKFIELRDLRNGIVHTLRPYFGDEIEKLAENFNKVKKGIGGLLNLINIEQGKESVGFIKKLMFAPTVFYNKK